MSYNLILYCNFAHYRGALVPRYFEQVKMLTLQSTIKHAADRKRYLVEGNTAELCRDARSEMAKLHGA